MFTTPLIPGPLTKNPKTSLNWVPTNSQYSSDAKTYSKDALSIVGIKSNSSAAASSILPVFTNFCKSISPVLPDILLLVFTLEFGPSASSTFPVDSTIPFSPKILE